MNWIETTFKNRLKNKLAILPIEELLIEMTNSNYFFPYNIWKKYFDKNSIESGKWISWFATRQAEKIDDLNYSDRLKKIIENEKTEKNIRRKAYFCLGHLSKNLKNKEIFEYIVNRLEIETEENQETILISITKTDKPIDYNLEPIISILKSGKLGMKTNAAISLKHSENPKIEDILEVVHLRAPFLRTVGTFSGGQQARLLLQQVRTIQYGGPRAAHGLACAVGQHVGVVQPMDGVGIARLACQVRRGATRVDVNLALFFGDLAYRQRHR